MNKRKRLLVVSTLLTVSVSGIMTSLGIFLNSVPLLILSSLILVSLPFTTYKVIKNN